MTNPKIRIGEWYEQLAYEADKKALASNAKAGGQSLAQQILAKAKHHNTATTLQALPSDGCVRLYQPLMLQNAETNCFLSIDTDDVSQGRTAVTTAKTEVPKLRNAWVAIPVKTDLDAMYEAKGEQDVLHYGQPFLLRTVDELTEKPLYLSSQAKSPQSHSPTTKNQEVYCTTLGNQQCIWTALYGHVEYRLEMEGLPVKANSILILRHQLTNTPLASSKAVKATDFGAEYEVCANKFLNVKVRNGNAPEKAENLWALVTAPAAASSQESGAQ